MQVEKSSREKRTEEKLKRELGSEILGHLEDPQVIEIMVNPDNTLWIEKLGSDPELVGNVHPSKTRALIGTVADSLGMVATYDKPIVEGELPIDGSRFEGILPPIVENPAFTLRKKATRIITLAEYEADGIITKKQGEFIRNAIANKKNIVVAGGTGSGKTTLVNAFIDTLSDVSPDDRLVIIEDTNELQCKSENVVIMRTSGNVNQRVLLKTTLRMRPDRIITGEVRGGEALDLLKSWNTGHRGGICTLHADSALETLERLEQMISEVSERDMMDFISSSIDLVVFIKKVNKSRKIEEILSVKRIKKTENEKSYNTTLIT